MNELQPQKQNDSCLDRGLLVSLRDGELSVEETAQVEAHLAACPYCSVDERSMRTASKEVYDLLALLEPSPAEIPETGLALAALQSKLAEQDEDEEHQVVAASPVQSKSRSFQSRKPFRRSPWWVAVAAAVVLALVLFPNAGALANEFLALFSVQQFQPVSIDPQSFRNGIGEDLQQFGTFTIQSNNLSSIQHPTQQQVEQALGFKLLLPTQLPPGVGHAVQFSLIDQGTGTFTFSAAKARAYLAKTGQNNVSIPPQLDRATYSVNLASGVIINYGNSCQSNPQSTSPSSSILPVHQASQSINDQGQQQSTSNSSPGITSLGCSGGAPFYIVEMPSPVIQATGKASLKDLLSFALSLPKLSSGARLLLEGVNLDTGVVPLPVPQEAQAQQVTTHGVTGVMMTDSSMKLGAVIWQTHGIIYGVAGVVSSSSQLLACANSLQ